MNPDDLDTILAWMRAAGIDTLEYEVDGERLSLALAPERSTVAVASSSPTEESTPIVSRAIGRCSFSHPGFGAALAGPGDSVREGEIVAYVALGSTLCAVIADGAGRLGARLCDEGTLVGYGSPIFEFLPGEEGEQKS